MTNDRIAVLTSDTDWAPELIAGEAHELLCALGKPVTYFVTSPYRFQREPSPIPVEFAPHPNLEARDAEAEMTNGMALTPGAVSFRAHALYWSSRLRPLLRQRGIRFSSSAMMYLQPGIRPYPIGHGLTELPIFWMDATHLEFCDLGGKSIHDIPRAALEAPGLKVLDVHPIHLVLNTQNREHYLSAKRSDRSAEAIHVLRRAGPGVRDVFLELVETLDRSGYRFVLLRDAAACFSE